ncbi:MAG TPA: polysaccharide pyruvyl transferase family protein, partial [Alphaproteobacteria bacterium]
RYVPDVIADYNPSKIILNVNPKMEAMFTASFPDLFANGRLDFYKDVTTVDQASVHCIVAATTLPHILGTTVHTVPRADGYLKKDKTLDYKTGTDKDFVIGISWFTKSLDAGYIRSLKLMDFDFLAKYKNIRVLDLQYGDTSAERDDAAKQGFDVYHDDSVDAWTAMQPFMDQIAACDLIISIDNTTVHAAGAMGVPCWTILAQEPFWRWPSQGDATPWYNSLRLFRQKTKDYAPLVEEIDAEFKKFLGGDRSVLTPAPYKSNFPTNSTHSKKALLINDTNACYSWGNFASMEGIKQDLASKDFEVIGIPPLELPWFPPHLPKLRDFDDWKYLAACRYRDPTLFYHMEHADEVIINGEGMMNGLSENALRLLYLAYVAKHFYKRRVSIINHSVYPEDKQTLSDPQKLAFYHKVYSVVDSCVVRDQISYDLLKSINIPVQLGMDTALVWLKEYLDSHDAPAKTKDAILTVGPGYDTGAAQLFADLCTNLRKNGLNPIVLSGAKWHVAQEDYTIERDLNDLMDEPVEMIRAKTIDDFMECLQGARIVISGFEQVWVMANALGIPVISLTTGTNALTGFGLSKMIDMPIPLFYEDPSVDQKLKNQLKDALQKAPLKNDAASDRLEKFSAMAEKNLQSF